MKKTILFTLLFIVLFAGFWYVTKSVTEPTVVRAAIDIGSGTTDLKVGKVNPKTNELIQIIFEQRVTVDYQKQLEQSSDQTFNSQIMNEGKKTLSRLKRIALRHGADKVVAVATAAFRKARNGYEFASQLTRSTSIDVRVISQEEEGTLAFYGALAKSKAPPDQAIVWDIGGGSFQFTFLAGDNDYYVERGKHASIPFRNYIIETIQEKNIKETTTPNPLSKKEMHQAIAHAKQIGEKISEAVHEKIQQPNAQVLTVGDLFFYGIHPLVGEKTTVTRDDLKEALFKLADHDDSQLNGGDYADVMLSNGLLVLGIMEGLNIDTLHILDVNNADGVLINPEYWKEN